MEIVNVTTENINDVVGFLEKVQTINKIDLDIVKNASVIMNKGEIDGVLSYEKFVQYGLIRYFVFKKNTDNDCIFKLFNHLLEKVKKEEIRVLITLIVKEEVINLFYNLGFMDMDKNYFFIEENNILETNFKEANILKLEIN